MQDPVTASAGHASRRVADLSHGFAEAIATQQDPLIEHRHWLWPAVWRILADGRPASAAQIARLCGRPAAEVAAVIAESTQAEVDREGRILGLGLTLIPTPHRVNLAGRDHTLYVWCVPDAFAVSSLLGEPLELTTRCHGTGRQLVLDLEPDRIRAVAPPEAVVSFVRKPDLTDLRGSICRHQNLFAGPQAAQTWLAEHPDGAIVTVAEAFHVIAPVLDAVSEPEQNPERKNS